MRGGWGFVRLNGFYGFMKLSELSNKRIDAPVPDDVDPADEAGDKPSFSDDVPESANDAESSAAPVRGTAKSMDWWTSGIQDIFARGVTATITDVATGISWKEIRKGGTNHADVQPLTRRGYRRDEGGLRRMELDAPRHLRDHRRRELCRLDELHAPRLRLHQQQQFRRPSLHPLHQQPHARQQQGGRAAPDGHPEGALREAVSAKSSVRIFSRK